MFEGFSLLHILMNEPLEPSSRNSQGEEAPGMQVITQCSSIITHCSLSKLIKAIFFISQVRSCMCDKLLALVPSNSFGKIPPAFRELLFICFIQSM
jgi:hypothetical protein